MSTSQATRTVHTADEVRNLERGTPFRVRLLKAMTWRDVHAVIYYTANKVVTLKMRDGTTIVGRLDGTPGYFTRDNRVWLRIEGRKTRKGIKPADIASWTGLRAPSLADAYCAFIVLTASNAADADVAEARAVAACM